MCAFCVNQTDRILFFLGAAMHKTGNYIHNKSFTGKDLGPSNFLRAMNKKVASIRRQLESSNYKLPIILSAKNLY
ncbi:MAG: hypothetical protein EA394_02660 [Bacteroidia bacterium]|nr:MAG: hypothetical protein EA394_02660 [Bacteroidia bacterium]